MDSTAPSDTVLSFDMEEELGMCEGDADLVTGSRKHWGFFFVYTHGRSEEEEVGTGGCSEGARKDILMARAVLGSRILGPPTLRYWHIAHLA